MSFNLKIYKMINNNYLIDFEKNSGIEENHLNSLQFPVQLPNDYLDLLKSFNGGNGTVGEEYLILHKVEELIKINKDYKIAKFDNKFFIIGSNGSGELIALDTRKKNPIYVLIPYIFEYDAIIELSNNVEGLFQRIFEKGYFGTP